MSRTRNSIILIVAFVLLVAGAVIASKYRHQTALGVTIKKIVYAPFTVTLPENGVVMHPLTQTIPTLIGGNIGRIYVKDGDFVAQGQLLATVDNPTLDFNAAGSQADYELSEANVATARINEENAKVLDQGAVDTNKSQFDEARRIYAADEALLANKAIARSTVDADHAKLVQAQVAYDQAVEQLRLGAVSGYGQNSVQESEAVAQQKRIINEQNQQQVSFERITAPISGVIQSIQSQSSDALRDLQPGDAVSQGRQLFTIAGGSGYIVKAQVDEQDIINVRIGQNVNVTGEDFPDQTIPGNVAAIAAIATKSTDASSTAKQVLTTIVLDRSPGFLKDGMSADVDILTSDVPHALSVPNDAVVKTQGVSYVFAIVNGVARKRAIKISRVGDTKSLVASGLAPGDVIVAQQMPGLTDGTTVTPLPSPSGSPLPSST